MLKKISHILLALLVAVTSMGMTVSKHYCGSTYASFSIYVTPESCCEGPCDQCHNETTTIKIKDDFSISSHEFNFTQIATLLPAEIQLLFSETPEVPSTFVIRRHTPPPLTVQRVLSNLQTFRL
ncbi:MAG: hypothetical protein COW63_16805 [Bacteroidetes bacterium CG18_big_fil_WC_8_21_14_2_50_41_14]|nr:MAG: hypothetical protein COW63_16805 [Bacteroidetes bacterium CG18_big_fil_WC_8_21_14_2_50_41_14]PIY33276.1 MAG: hypothetical protein COZ08_05505 [Bacteroidetes bacterium CG_4_10_14_3_um_filter_42_6]PJB54735.1 MAG: hypothetical protein CO098_20105 [Bacteroidetes bacterium CG_4_9_14_3_um_filter_41_19]